MGTRFLTAKAARPSKPRRSKKNLRSRCQRGASGGKCSELSGDKNLLLSGLPAESHLVGFQGTGRGAGYVLAVQTVHAVVAITENIAAVAAEFHRAIDVGTIRIEGPDFSARHADQQARLAAEVERGRPMTLGIGFQLVDT